MAATNANTMRDTINRSVTNKMRRDVSGGTRGRGRQNKKSVERPNPGKLRVKGGGESLSSFGGLVLIAQYIHDIGIDDKLKYFFGT